MARTDYIINVAGHGLSTGALKEVLTAHPDVSECAVAASKMYSKASCPSGPLVLKVGAESSDSQIVAKVGASIRSQIGPVADGECTLGLELPPTALTSRS